MTSPSDPTPEASSSSAASSGSPGPSGSTASAGPSGSVGEASPSLQQDTRGGPENFGLDVRRLRLVRTIVLGVLAVPILVLALITTKFVSMPVTQAWHDSAYRDGDFTVASERLAPVWVVNWFEPYLPHLTSGTDLLQEGDNAGAEAELRTALEKWTDSSDLNQPMHAYCKILNNLAVSIERQADEIEDPAERAERLYEAEELIAPCAGGGGGDGEDGEGGGADGEDGEGGGPGNEDEETTEENGERIREKRRGADEEAGNDPDDRETEQGEGGDEPGGGEPPEPGDPRHSDPDGDGPDEETPTPGDDEDQEKQDELEQRNRDAQGGDGEEDPGGDDQDPAQPW